jgi:ATP-dependent helicase HrpB
MLPIEDVLPALRTALRGHAGAVLQAPPGAGKTTRVPLALLDEPWLGGGKIVMLEPRRLAARAAARRMAGTLGEPVGATVGYRVRADSRVGRGTRVEVVTEGVLTRMLQSDPALEGVGLVIFDEFHERSLHADLGLALTLQARQLLREELRVLVMSATLEGAPVAGLLGAGPGAPAPVVASEGRGHPVETRYRDRRAEGPLERDVARAVLRALDEAAEGDLLVFLPGAGEIRRVEERLAEAAPGPGVLVAPLHGSLPQELQDRAVEPAPPGRRKVVLATSIAETSLTIEGVRVVIDAGLMRVPRFSPRTGMTRLATVPVSAASADQRRGRAGRLGPGLCYRLWTAAEQGQLVPFGTPEILDADLAPLALELALWGIHDPLELRWLDPPPAAALSQARELLAELGALDASGAATPAGREMAALGLHPRLARMLLRGRALGLGSLACELAALLGERDLFRSAHGPSDVDLRLRVEALRRGGRGLPPGTPPVDGAALHRVREEAERLRSRLGLRRGADDPSAAGALLALAYPDRIGQRRPGAAPRYLLRNGRGAVLPGPQAIGEAEYLVAVDVDGRGAESRVHLAAPLARADLERLFGDRLREEAEVAWDREAGLVRAWVRTRLGALVVAEAPDPAPDPERVAATLLEAVLGAGLDALPWTPEARQLQQRIRFLAGVEEGWPEVSDGALARTAAEWLAPHLHGLRRLEEVRRLPLEGILLGMLRWDRRAALDEQAPTHLEVPSGSRIRIDYADPERPVLAVRLQEVFGLQETPRVAGGRVPLTLHLLSPARRPVQVTRDLGSFWRSAYFEVRKDLRGRYPKHSWPDDPGAAVATRRVRPRA